MNNRPKKGIVLAGGAGNRLYPLTSIVCKQLLPVYDKPLIYYPLSVLMQFGIREIMIISTPDDLPKIMEMFGDGSALGLNISYAVQDRPDGIAQAYILAHKFIGQDTTVMILGDNIFYGVDNYSDMVHEFEEGGMIFGYYMKDPRRYGVIEFDENDKPVSIIEKPSRPSSNYAVTGLYIYDAGVVEAAKSLKPSTRNELEITDINNIYLKKSKLEVVKFGRGVGWLDAGTFESLLDAGNYISTIEKRQGVKIGCIEEIAFRSSFITENQFENLINAMPDNSYKGYLYDVLKGD